MVRLSWALLFASLAATLASVAHAQEGAGALTAPPPAGGTPAGQPAATDDIPPPPPGYGTPAPPGYQGDVPPPPGAVVPPPGPVQPAEPTDPDRRAGGEMVELYITGSLYGVLTGGWLTAIAFDGPDAGSGTIPLLLGAGGAMAVLGADAAQDGFRTGVPASISMGLFLGALEGVVGLAAFERDIESDESALTLVWGLTTLGGVGGTLLGSWLRPSIGDTRLVASSGVWGAYFAGLAAIAAGTEGEDAWRWVLAGLNAGAVLGMVLAPVIDLTAGRVMLLHAGMGAGAFLGFTVAAGIAGAGEFEPETLAVTIGVGSALGLAGMYLLIRPRGGASEPAQTSTAWSPYVAPVEGGGVVGFHGAL